MNIPQIEMQVVENVPVIPDKIKKQMTGLYGGLIAMALIIFIFSAIVAFQEKKITEFAFFLFPVLGAIGVAIYGLIDILSKENSAKKKKIILVLEIIFFTFSGIVSMVAGALGLVFILFPIIYVGLAGAIIFFTMKFYKSAKYRTPL